MVSVQLRWLLGKKRGQMCKPAQVPKDEQGLRAMTCGQDSLPGEAVPAFLGRGPGEEQRKEGVGHDSVSGSAFARVFQVSLRLICRGRGSLSQTQGRAIW